MRGSRRGPPSMISKPLGTNGVGSRAKVAIVGLRATFVGEDESLEGGGKMDGGDGGAGGMVGGGVEVGGRGVMGGGSAGNGGGDGVAGVIGLGRDPRVETEAAGEYISADRSGETELARGTHL